MDVLTLSVKRNSEEVNLNNATFTSKNSLTGRHTEYICLTQNGLASDSNYFTEVV